MILLTILIIIQLKLALEYVILAENKTGLLKIIVNRKVYFQMEN